MNDSSNGAERIAADIAQAILRRAALLDSDAHSVARLREAATEAGISPEAFDAAVAEWRAAGRMAKAEARSTSLVREVLHNVVAAGSGWVACGAFAVFERVVDAPWLIHKLTDPIGLALGAAPAVRLRARSWPGKMA